MRMVFRLPVALAITISLFVFSARAADPYRDVTLHKLPNGLTVVLAPGPKAETFRIKAEVKVGWDVEEPRDRGVSHLLEHYLFQDESLGHDMTYLEVIKEAGGEANGFTWHDETAYVANVTPSKGEWLIKTMAKMLFRTELKNVDIEKAKSVVLLEIGEPSPISKILGFDYMRLFQHKFLRTPDFWETEFGIQPRESYTRPEERLATTRLGLENLERHYRNYYYPSNMTLYVAGRFDPKAVLATIEKTWGAAPDRKGLTVAERVPVFRDGPYISSSVSSHPHVSVGVKVWKPTFREDLILHVYLNSLSHRLMKELRNVKGQTYTVSPTLDIKSGYGYAAIGFETTKENYDENLKLVKDKLHAEAVDGKWSDTEVNDAIALYRRLYDLTDADAETLLGLAENYREKIKDYGAGTPSGYEVLEKLQPAEVRASLQNLFKPEREYAEYTRPNFFFKGDEYLLVFISVLFAFRFFRRSFTQQFDHQKVRWVRKINSSPMLMTELAGAALLTYVASQYFIFLARLPERLPWFRANVFLNEYAAAIVGCFGLVGIGLTSASVFPRKLIVCGDYLYIKTLTFYSYKYSLSELREVRLVKTWWFPFSARALLRGRVHYSYWSAAFWRPGVLLTFQDGHEFYLSFKNPARVRSELEAFRTKAAAEEAPPLIQAA